MTLKRRVNGNLTRTFEHLPSISHESRIISEGRITAEECGNVLKTFPTAQTPGQRWYTH